MNPIPDDTKLYDILMSPQALWNNHLYGNIKLPIYAMREEIERPYMAHIKFLQNILQNKFDLIEIVNDEYHYVGPSAEFIDAAANESTENFMKGKNHS